ncbi:MAG: hypothetical protein Q8M07_19950 [Prosthecobacter sp.]|nr:hypothetical protein [Prosthecobacter sp.]
MAKKTTLDDVVKILAEHGKEIRDLAASVANVVKHMATKDDIAQRRHRPRAGAGELDRSGTEVRPLRKPPRQA